ncbi:hypothetical protein BC936DRAFT_144282 [Jimgerdemannia flammicorona]|uniref:Methyltransferase domain-containing protein n=1 Tax=Jimgerdemannia flammicorona TaxID=994334 RepID=A0A433DCQ3_9FUNG|nr:hypothetical protein BC936DRAFT_144282 [Jimgerdemannia flammicorona]
MGQEQSKLWRKSPTTPSDEKSFGSSQQSQQTASWIRKHEKVKSASSSYFLPHDDREVDRLHQLNFVMKEVFQGNILSSAEHCLQEGALILDVGCGPGTWVLDVATEYPEIEFVGLDVNSIFPETIKPPNATFIRANILSGLPFEDDTFDLVHMKQMNLAYQKEEWPKVLDEIFRVTKPGGFAQLTEIGSILTSTDPVVQKFSERIEMLLSASGNDTHPGIRLVELEENAGFKVIQHDMRRIPMGWDGAIGDLMVDDLRQVLFGPTKQFLMAAFGMEVHECDTYLEDIIGRLGGSKTYKEGHKVAGQKPEQMEQDV